MENAKQFYLKAREHWSAGRANEAQASYREAIRLDPNLPHPHFDLAKLLEILGKDEAEIINYYERFIALASGNPKLAPQVEQARQRINVLRSAKPNTSSVPRQDNVPPVAQQPVPPQVVYVPIPTLAQPPNLVLPETRADMAKPGCTAVVFGIFTMIISAILLLAFLVLFIVAVSANVNGTPNYAAAFAMICIPALFFLFGIVAGALLAFGKGHTGKVLVVIFWIILLVGAIGVGIFFFLLMGLA